MGVHNTALCKPTLAHVTSTDGCKCRPGMQAAVARLQPAFSACARLPTPTSPAAQPLHAPCRAAPRHATESLVAWSQHSHRRPP